MTTIDDDTSPTGVDPGAIGSREELAAALTALRASAGLSVRDVVDRSGGIHGTITGWFAGQHLPTSARTGMFIAVLDACGVTGESAQAPWLDAVRRVRSRHARRGIAARPPYRGLEAFREDDAEWFFGREDLTATLVARVERAAGADDRILMVFGPSGSGKSSLLRAGLASSIGRAGSATVSWRVRVFTPGIDPLGCLAEIPSPGAPTLVIVDQFEELWTQVSEPIREEFLDSLAARVAADPDLVVVLGMRADFYGSAAREAVLLPALDAGPVVVGPLTDNQLRRVIVEPAGKAKLAVSDELVQVLLGDLAPRASRRPHDTGSLPLLSHALLGTWQRAERKTLTVADYYATGGIGGAVQQSAEEVFAGLTADQQRLARRIFLRLVNVDDDTQTRRRTPRAELFHGDDVADVNTVIDAFAMRRLLTVDEETVEVSHEALLSAWQRLRDWIDRDRAGLIVHRRLTQASQVWEESGRDRSDLLGEGRLALVEDWLGSDGREPDLNEVERDFLSTSVARRDEEQRASRRRGRVVRRFVAALVVVSILAVVMAVSALVERSAAERQRDEAMSRQVATEAVQLRDEDPALAAQLALVSYRISPTLQARSALLDSTAVHTPTRLVGANGGTKSRIDATGRLLGVAGADGVVRLHLVSDGVPESAPVAELPVGTTQPLYALAFSPDGTLLAAGGGDGASLWDISQPAAPQRVSTLSGGSDVVQDLMFSADGRRLVAGTSASGVLRWDVDDSARPVARPALEQPGDSVTFAAISPDGRWLATGGGQSALRVWDLAAWDTMPERVFEIVPDGTTDRILDLDWSPDGTTLAAGTSGRVVKRWDFTNPSAPVAKPALDGFTSYVNDVAFSRDGTRLGAGSSDNSIRLWDTTSDRLLETLPSASPVTSLQFGADDRVLVSAAASGITHVWPLPGSALPGATSTVFVNQFGGDGAILMAGVGSKGSAHRLWDTRDIDHVVPLPDLRPEPGDVFTGAIALSRSGRLAAAGTGAGGAYLWDLTEPAAPRRVSAPTGVVAGLAATVTFDPAESRLAVAAQDAPLVKLLDVTDPSAPREVAAIDARNYPLALAFSPDGTRLAIATADNVVHLWDVSGAEPKPLVTVDGFENYAQALAFSPDGRTLAAGSADGTVRLWDVSDAAAPRELARLADAADAVYSVSFSPSGDRLAAGVGGGVLLVWDTSDPADPTRFAVLTASGARVNDAAFGRDGAVIAGSGPDKVVRLWGTDPDAVAERLCRTAGTAITEDEWRRHLPGVRYEAPCG